MDLPDFWECLVDMERNGTSVLLSWGEDDGTWECSWITGGKRYTEYHSDPKQAVWLCRRKVFQKFGVDDPLVSMTRSFR